MKRSDVQVERLSAWVTGRPPESPMVPAPILDWAGGQLAAAGAGREAEVVQTLDLLDELNADAETLAAALLYDCGEPLPGSLALTEPVANLLAGQREAEKVWSIYAQAGGKSGVEGLRRLLLAIIRDLRVVLILLARQLVQMRLAVALPDEQRRRLAQLTADIHSPLANRLGIWQLKWELEDLAFRYLQPDVYKRIARLLDERRVDRERFIEDFKARLRAALADAGIHGEVAGRPKHIYSIWKKMQRKGVPFSELYDIRAVRVLVDSVADCYAALGIVHGTWTPIPAEFDDYIANPKGNNYRSLHTAVAAPDGRTVEIQIRTREMHEHAELGVAAHWRYKEGGGADADLERKIAWMRQLLEGRDGDGKESDEDAALAAELSTALVEDRIYVLTPQGQVIDLPRGGTVLDFAYHVHTEVGHRCRGAKVNGRIVPLNHQPRTGDRIEILTGKTSEPRRDWLLAQNGFLASARARDKVRAWFHRLDLARNISEGREVLERELRRLALSPADLVQALPRLKLQKLDELYVAVALGDIGPAQVARALHEASQPEPARTAPLAKPPKPATGFTIEGVGNLLTQLARCCQPVSGDSIVGYLTKGRGVSIHREGCPSVERLIAAHPERMLPVEWGKAGGQSFGVDVTVHAFDRKWLIKDLTNIIGTSNAHILGLNSRVDPDTASAELKFSLKVTDFDQLGHLLARMAGVPGVTEVRRTP